eukprot:3052554-Prymnesium_polylepis.1
MSLKRVSIFHCSVSFGFGGWKRPGQQTTKPRAAYLARRSSYDGCRGHACSGFRRVRPVSSALTAQGKAHTAHAPIATEPSRSKHQCRNHTGPPLVSDRREG